MSEIVVGNPAPIEQGFNMTYRRGAGGGTEYDQAWAGTRSAILDKFGVLRADATIAEVNAFQSPGSAVAVVRARMARLPGETEEAIQETLGIRWNDATLDMHRNPTFVNITSARIKALNDDAEEGTNTPTDPTELKYYNLRQLGVTSYRATLPVVTYTITAPINTGERLNVAGTGKIFSTVAVPVTSFFDIAEINVGLSADAAATYIAGWRLIANGDYLANGNAQLVAEYEFGLWESALYIEAT